jgi:hypothetical protein
MGAGLEMITHKFWTSALALGLLVSCGPLAENSLGANFLKDRIGKASGTTAASQPVAAPAVDPATAAPGEILIVTIMSRNAVAPLTKIAQNGNTVTWVSPGKVSLTLKDGILIATRGLNEDLMGADVAGVRAALAAGGGTATRTHSFLDSEDQIRLDRLNCTITPEGVEEIAAATGTRKAMRYDERCEGRRVIFTNSYWLDTSGGRIVQSRQAVAPTTGFLQINPL